MLIILYTNDYVGFFKWQIKNKKKTVFFISLKICLKYLPVGTFCFMSKKKAEDFFGLYLYKITLAIKV
ncbi:MAG: hypothetical protein CME66_09370 [Halobacteriovoraceae bacterium]|nr:hypothetical protein [Halobacteriovoraceae bacterium]